MVKRITDAPPMAPELVDRQNLSDLSQLEQLQRVLQEEGNPVANVSINKLIEAGFVEDRMIQENGAGTTIFHLSSARPLPFAKLSAAVLKKIGDISPDHWPPGFKSLREKDIKPGDISLQSSPEVLDIVFNSTIEADTQLQDVMADLSNRHNTNQAMLTRILTDTQTAEDEAWVAQHGADFNHDYTAVNTEFKPKLGSEYSDIIVNTWYKLKAKIDILVAVQSTASSIKKPLIES